MQQLGQLIVDNEDWLVDRVVHYAVTQGFAEYTSTLREAWRASICGLSGPILQAIRAAGAGSGSNSGFGAAREEIIAFGVEQAMRHRSRGVRLKDFLGLLKYYRRAYLDLIDDSDLSHDDRRTLRGYILDFFDHVEIGLCSEWAARSDTDRLRDLQDQNKRLSNEKNKYLTIFESIREPVILLDAVGAPVHLNDAAHRLFCGEVAPGASYYGALRSPLLNSQIAEILKSEDGSDMAIETLAGPREFDVKVQRMLDVSRKFDGTVIILNDVSEYKRALRRARAADHAKSTFLAAVSHEIRTPIAGALGLARLLRDTSLTGSQEHLLDGIISSAELLSGVVGDILDFSQAEVGAHPPAPQDFDLGQLVRQVLMVVEPLAGEKGLSLTTEIAPTLPPRLHGDASMIRQVLLNLTHNAIKFTDAGSVQVQVRPSESRVAADHRVRFEVHDTGIGLPSGPTERLFEAFSQGERQGDRAKGGLGLGLAICRKIVRRMGGEIDGRPGDDGGSVFFIELPLAAARDARVVPAQPPQSRALRILVVDDDRVSRMVAEGFLTKLGHRPSAVDSAAEALRRLQLERFDLVLSDNRMPEISGLELVGRIRTLTTGPNIGIPVVVVTASADDVRGDRVLRARPDGVLAKPYDEAALAREISRLTGAEPCSGAPLSAPTEKTVENDFGVAEKHILNLGRERGCRVIQAFLDSAPRHIASLKDGLEGGNRQAAAAAAHSLAGASGLLGLAAVESLAREIEALAANPASPVPQETVAALQAGVADASEALRRMCEAADEPGRH